MSYSVIIGGDDQYPLATVRGWADTKAWIDKLDATEFALLVNLAEWGWTEGLADLRSQILAALKANPPSDSTVADTMKKLASTLEGQTASSIFVSDGTSEDDGGADDGWEVGDVETPPDVKSLALPGSDESFIDAPTVPDFDSLAEDAMRSATAILARARRKLLNHERGLVDLQDELNELDLLVAQSYLASQVAGSVDVFRGANFTPPPPMVYSLEVPHEWWKAETTTRFPWITEAARWLESRGVVSKSELSSIVRVSEGASRVRWDSIKSVGDLSKELSQSLIGGETVEQFKKRIDAATLSARSHLEVGFRTATHQAYVHGKTNTLEKPSIQRIFPAVEYFATMDTRTRASHRLLDRVAVEIGSEAYVVVRRALADFNCRCNVVSIYRKNLAKYRVIRDASELPAEVLAAYHGGGLVGVFP